MAKRSIPELIIEQSNHTENEFRFLSLIEYKNQKFLTIIDNIVDNMVYAYVLDSAFQESINLEGFLAIVQHWSIQPNEPISFTFSRMNINGETSKLYRTFEVTGITRLIGASYRFNIHHSHKIKRRRIIEPTVFPDVLISDINQSAVG